MTPTRDQELWALTLWVEKHHGDDGAAYIDERIEHFTTAGETGAVDMWEAVAQRYANLTSATAMRTH
ncbi:hypothetical protein AAG612_04105 [Citromicrobium bathyomarinum]|uniref:DUF6961 family protein n=1 Tax=Citromicrobium bathyomarinum TaxID=72174 RepID=UPI00315A65E1